MVKKMSKAAIQTMHRYAVYMYEDELAGKSYIEKNSLEYGVERIRILSVGSSGDDRFLISAFSVNEGKSIPFSIICNRESIKDLVISNDEIYVVYCFRNAESKYLIAYYHCRVVDQLSKIYSDLPELNNALTLLACLSEKNRKLIEIRLGLTDEIPVKDGKLQIPVMIDDEGESEIIYELSKPLIPPYIVQGMELVKIEENQPGNSDSKKRLLETRKNFYRNVIWGLPLKHFNVEEAFQEMSQDYYARNEERIKILNYVYAYRKKVFQGKSISGLYAIEKERPAVITLIGSPGIGKELLARVLAKSISYTYDEFDLGACGTDTSELFGSSTIYSNSDIGEFTKILFRIGDNGCLIVKGFDSAQSNIKLSISNIIRQGYYRENSLDSILDFSKMTFIILARDISEVPRTIQDHSLIISFSKYTDAERLIIAKKYLFPKAMITIGLDEEKIQFTDMAFSKLVNSYRVTSSLDEVLTNLTLVLGKAQTYCSTDTYIITEEMVDSLLFPSLFPKFTYDFSMVKEKYKRNRGRYTKDEQEKIEQLFEEEEVCAKPYDREIIKSKLRFWVNYMPEYDTKSCKSVREKKKLNIIKKTMEEKEYGHTEAKQKIMDALQASMLSGTDICKSLQLLLYGPAGTGKTMLAKVLADALNISFLKIPLNGMVDPTALKGNAYKLGSFAEALMKSGRKTLVLLDEIDKAGPMVIQSLYDITDPSEGRFFNEYLEDYIDTTGLILIATANDISDIPTALIDRFCPIQVRGYTEKEKCIIAGKFTIPKILNELHLKNIEFCEDAIITIVNNNTSSIRRLEEDIRRVILYVDREKIRKINKDVVDSVLGHRIHTNGNMPVGEYTPGTVNCLGVSINGSGCVFPVEVVPTPYLNDRFITGNPKQMILDSIKMADVIISNLLGKTLVNTAITFGQQGVIKDGPSAGLAIVAAMYSVHTGLSVPRTVAMTGEIDIQAYVWPVGGVLEKLSAAKSAGVKKVYIPRQNYELLLRKNELNEFADLNIVPVNHVTEMIDDLFHELNEHKEITGEEKHGKRTA